MSVLSSQAAETLNKNKLIPTARGETEQEKNRTSNSRWNNIYSFSMHNTNNQSNPIPMVTDIRAEKYMFFT